jgi:hypothetical protein
MTAPVWVRELAASFWSAAGGPPPPARDLRGPTVRALPLTSILLPDLCVAEVREWLRRNCVPCALHTTERPLRACLVARSGHGAVFLDGNDNTDEQRFSLAHELAHFLHDYQLPRLEAVQRYGPGVLEVFDGKRPPRQDERIHALLAAVPIGFQVHLMDRQDGRIVDTGTRRIEADADRLAFQLLAPEDEVLAAVAGVAEGERREAIRELLHDIYGLPPGPAARYAASLTPERAPSFARRLWTVT